MNWQPGTRPRLGAAALLAALVSYFLMNHLMLEMLIDYFDTRGFLKTFVYVAWMGAGFAAFAGVLLTLRKAGLTLLLLVTGVSAGTNYAFDKIAKQEITPDYMEWMVQELGNFGAAWAEFSPEIVAAAFKAALFVVIFLGLRFAVRRWNLLSSDVLSRGRVRAAALGVFLALHGFAMLLQPSYTVAETNIVVFGAPALITVAPVKREQPAIRPAGASLAEKVYFIVDESVAYDMYRHTAASAVKAFPAVDFGRGASLAACSAASNALLRWGVVVPRVNDPRYDPRTNPTIWAYAKAAGFRTVLIDGQMSAATQNLLNSEELALIDEFIPAAAGIETDIQIARTLLERASRPGREFIYVVKRGSHFAYDNNYPEGMVARGASRFEKYLTSVTYATRRFFETLAPMQFSNMVLIYTSDHGQNLDSRALHCSGRNDPREYAVPLVAITGVTPLAAQLRAAQDGMRDRGSHLNAFATMLEVMGYRRAEIEARYGPTLAGPPGDYIWVDSWLPHPTRRHAAVKFRKTKECPGCGEG